MGKDMNKKQMCASVCLTRIPFFLFMQQATLEEAIVQCIFLEVEAIVISSDVIDLWHQT